MRIRNYRQGDIPTLVHIQQLAARADGVQALSETDFEQWFAQPELDPQSNVFVITDDDDELNEWGQGGTLEGLEGEAVGYSVLQMRKTHSAYHFLCEGAVLPQHRRRDGGQSLLICALNHARIRASEFEFEAAQAGHPIYFEALLPIHDAGSDGLARKCGMKLTDETTLEGMGLYRCQL